MLIKIITFNLKKCDKIISDELKNLPNTGLLLLLLVCILHLEKDEVDSISDHNSYLSILVNHRII